MDGATLLHAQSTITLYTEFTQASNSKNDLQTHFRSLAIMPFDRPYDFLLVYRCNYDSILHRFQDIIAYFLKSKDVT